MTISPPPSVDAWSIEQSSFDPATLARDGALFALANGAIGVRGGIDELPHMHASFLPSAYLRRPVRYHESFPGFADGTDSRLTGPGLTMIQVEIDGTEIDFEAAEMLAFRRTLDLATGVLARSTMWLLPDGRELEIEVRRMVPFGAGAVCVSRYEVRSVNFAASIRVHCPVALCDPGADAFDANDPRISARAHLAQVSTRSTIQGHEWCFAPATGGKPKVTIAQRIAGGEDNLSGSASLAAGEVLTFDRFVAASTAEGGETAIEAAALAQVEAAEAAGFERLLEQSRMALEGFWKTAAMGIDADPALQLAVRFNLFHIFQSASRSGSQGVAAKGLTGEGYEGHYFWDTEAFVLPVLALTAPDLARHLIEYRVSRLADAREHARAIGHAKGALYPWRTIGGRECSTHYPTGSAQYHVNAAIAYAVEIYVATTGDRSILEHGAAEMLFDTARLWMDTGYFCERRGGAFLIHGVTGPDEYSALVDNDFYTNAMARRHLLFAASVARDLGAVAADEIAGWQRAAMHMWLPVDPATGVHPQDDGFMDKPPFPQGARDPSGAPLLVKYHPLVLFRHRLCKQGDVVQAHAIGATHASQAQIRRDLAYYEPLTTHDSTLSATAFAIAAARCGETADALGYLNQTAFVDLHDLHANTWHGCHLAAMAGSWLALAQGWGGLTIADGVLSLAPTCPDAWTSFSFRFHWRGATVEVAVNGCDARYSLIDGPVPLFFDRGREVDLSRGPVLMQPPAFDAAIFDLDGVITDTAEAHYIAWKRLCDEEGIAFDRSVNEGLKGVDRSQSLARIAEAAGIEIPVPKFEAMLVRKNGYYREALAGFGPGDLFPGVERLLADCRNARLKIGLASASRNASDLVRRLGIESCFDFVADAAKIANGKPHPDIFTETALALGVAPDRCVGIEDSAAGITAIRAAGMLAVGVGNPGVLPGADLYFRETGDIRLADLFDVAAQPANTRQKTKDEEKIS